MNGYIIKLVLKDKKGNNSELTLAASSYENAKSLVKFYKKGTRGKLVAATMTIIYHLEEK